MATEATTGNANTGADGTGTGVGTSTSTAAAGNGSGQPSSPVSAESALERAAASSAAATGVPASAQGDVGSKGQPGAETGGKPAKPYHVPPREEWEGILSNARMEAERRVTDQLGWAKDLNRDEVMGALDEIRRFRANPMQYIRENADQLGLTPEEEELVDPEPDLVSQDGKRKAYSHDAVRTLLGNMEKRILRQVNKEYADAREFAKAGKEAMEKSELDARAADVAQETLTYMNTLPHFKENIKAIGKLLQEMDPKVRRRVGTIPALFMCFEKFKAENIYPTIQSEAERKVREDNLRAANASTGTVVPGHGLSNPRKPIRDGDVDALAARMRELNAEMSQPSR